MSNVSMSRRLRINLVTRRAIVSPVNAPVIPFLTHQSGDDGAEQVVAIVGILHVADDPPERRRCFGAPLG